MFPIKNLFSILAILLFALSVNIVLNTERTYDRNHYLLQYDMAGYYSFLPAIFIQDDLSFQFLEKEGFDIYQFVKKIPNQTQLNKYSVGPSILLSPFFLGEHYLGKKGGGNGLGMNYLHSILLGVIFYVSLGFFFLRMVLLHYFKDWVVAVTILSIGLGTNLLYYTAVDGIMSHSFSFFLYSVLLWSTWSWIQNGNKRALPLLGITLGLITCTRTANLIIGLIPLLWGIKNFSDIRERTQLILHDKRQIVIAFLFFLIGFFPQILYFKLATGNYWVNVYFDEGFFFSQPLTHRFMFSFRNGWLIYSPIMLFSLLGFYVVWKKYRDAFWPIFLFFLLNVYILSSWWCWWYVGYGMRTMVESSALLSIPLAASISYFLHHKFIRWFFIPLFALMLTLNFVQTHQYIKGIIPWDGMNWETYKIVFGYTDPMEQEVYIQRNLEMNKNVRLNTGKAIKDKEYRWEYCK